MKHLLTLLLLALSTTAYAEPLTVDAAYGVAYQKSELKLATIPNDQAMPYVTVYASGSDLARISSWFESGELAKLKAASHYNEVDSRSPMFLTRYAGSVPKTPLIRYQAADGTVIKDFDAPPLSAEAFIRQFNKCQRNCPQPTPERDPPAQPILTKPANDFPWLIIAILTIIGAGAGVVDQYKVIYFNRK